MATTQVLKPITGQAVLDASFGTGLGDTYTIKVTDIAVQARTNVQDVTGDGDTDVSYEHNSLAYYNFQQRGLMVGGTGSNGVGILNIVEERTDGDPPHSITATQASNYQIFVNAPCWVTSVDIQWNYSGSAIGVAISGVLTDTGTQNSAAIVDVG